MNRKIGHRIEDHQDLSWRSAYPVAEWKKGDERRETVSYICGGWATNGFERLREVRRWEWGQSYYGGAQRIIRFMISYEWVVLKCIFCSAWEWLRLLESLKWALPAAMNSNRGLVVRYARYYLLLFAREGVLYLHALSRFRCQVLFCFLLNPSFCFLLFGNNEAGRKLEWRSASP